MSRESMGKLGVKRPGRKPAQQGFTLIEMSIVLAIIGLIVGGILKGQEVVNNGRLKMQVAQMDAIKAAFFTFQDQYTFMPGDYPSATQLGFTSNTVSGGDGNGIIGKPQSGTGASPSAAILADSASEQSTESVLAWAHLVGSNLMQGVTLPTDTSLKAVGTTTGLYYPGKMSGTFLWIATFNATSAGLTAPMIRLQLPISGVLSQGASGQALREPDAYNIDRKYDDGGALTGSIFVDSISDANNCETNGIYTMANGGSPNTNYCTMLWVIE